MSAAPATSSESAEAAGGRVWLVWSDRPSRALIRAQCREDGLETIAFESLGDALEALAARGVRRPGVLVVDAGDAARDPEAWERLRHALPETRRVAVAPRTRESRLQGVDVELPRPLEIAHLVRKVREAFQKSHSPNS